MLNFRTNRRSGSSLPSIHARVLFWIQTNGSKLGKCLFYSHQKGSLVVVPALVQQYLEFWTFRILYPCKANACALDEHVGCSPMKNRGAIRICVQLCQSTLILAPGLKAFVACSVEIVRGHQRVIEAATDTGIIHFGDLGCLISAHIKTMISIMSRNEALYN